MRTFGRLTFEDGSWEIEADPHVILRAKRIFARLDSRSHGALRLSNTAVTAREIEWFLDRYPLDATEEDRARLRERAEEHRARESVLAKLLSGHREARRFELAVPPRDYQRLAADLCLSTGGILCADDLGIGKTVTGICVLSEPRCRPALVVTLTHLPRQWEAEINRFCPELRTHVLKKGSPYDFRVYGDGRPRRRHGRVEQLTLDPADGLVLPDVVITSYSKLSGWADTLAPIVKSVIYDEVQELRRDGSNKAAAARHISREVEYRLGLSATPIYNHGDEIYSVLEAIRPGALGTRDEFLQEWCRGQNAYGSAQVRDPVSLGTYLRENGLMIRRTRADVGRELPSISKVHQTIECDLSVLEAAEDSASELARVILGGTSSFEERGLAARELDTKLRQATGIAKAPFVAEFVRMVAETGEKVVLFGWHREVYSIWMERLKAFAPALYTGTESAKQKDEARRRFVEGESPILIMSLRSGAGLDGLQEHARTLVFGELDWSPGVHSQCEGRLHRDGQTDPVVAYYLTAEDGADPIIADVLGVKEFQARGLRDPNAPLVEQLQSDGGHAKKLAEAYLRRRAA